MTEGVLRGRLRAETADLHERLHRHPGLSAAASGAIDMDDYRALLMRLYGFHRAFESRLGEFAGTGEALARSQLLASDLQTLGVTPEKCAYLPICDALPSITQEAEALGALYVVEGSSLGGARIAQALRANLLRRDGKGCRFFSNDGARPRAWENVLTRLNAIDDRSQEQAVIAAARATFQAFDAWMKGVERAVAPRVA
ncbi:biliverdin-producing heme oxygenase [Methylocystis parvus]|uniref:biliverdin-producing heme oxygenase n=1 Tax=Methylocystis parvus TaxID=134 RepID=UPI003C794783